MAEEKPKRSIELSNLNIWLQPKQEKLRQMIEASGPGVPTVIGNGGSRGKSGGLRRIAIIEALDWPGTVTYIIRRVLGDLLENHMEKIKLEFPQVHEFYKAGAKEYEFPNGSRIAYKYAECKADVERISYGPECTFLLVDQAEQFSEDELTSFRICNRWPNMPPGFVKAGYFFNVGKGIGAGFLRRVFHTKYFKPNENGGDFSFLPAYSWDNFEWFRGQVEMDREDFYQLSSEERFALFVTQTTEGRKMNQLPKHRREGELLGNFDSFSGQYFSDVWN